MTAMSRISVYYGGSEYAISGRALDDVRAEIERGVAASEPAWLEARIGRGRSTVAHLLLRPGIPIALVEVNTDGTQVEREELDVGHLPIAPDAHSGS